MRNALVIAALVCSFALSGTALAAGSAKPREVHQGHPTVDRFDDGVISAIDRNNGTITLTDGQTYDVPWTTDMSTLKPGDTVSVAFTANLDTNRIEVNAVRLR